MVKKTLTHSVRTERTTRVGSADRVVSCVHVFRLRGNTARFILCSSVVPVLLWGKLDFTSFCFGSGGSRLVSTFCASPRAFQRQRWTEQLLDACHLASTRHLAYLVIYPLILFLIAYEADKHLSMSRERYWWCLVLLLLEATAVVLLV